MPAAETEWEYPASQADNGDDCNADRGVIQCLLRINGSAFYCQDLYRATSKLILMIILTAVTGYN